jgi:hypothetical protein
MIACGVIPECVTPETAGPASLSTNVQSHALTEPTESLWMTSQLRDSLLEINYILYCFKTFFVFTELTFRNFQAEGVLRTQGVRLR